MLKGVSSTPISGEVEGNFQKKIKICFFFFVELKVNNICIDLCLFKNLFAGRFAFFID